MSTLESVIGAIESYEELRSELVINGAIALQRGDLEPFKATLRLIRDTAITAHQTIVEEGIADAPPRTY